MSQLKEATNATKSEPAEKQCTCPEDAVPKARAPKTKQRKHVAAAANQEGGFLIQLVPTAGHDLSALRQQPAPRRPAPRSKAPQRAPATMLLTVGQQPAVALVPPLPGAATAPYLTATASPYLPLTPGCPPFAVTAVANAAHGNSGCGGCHTGCSHGHCCANRGDYSSSPNTLTIPPYAMPFFGDIYRNAAAAHVPPAGGGNINVVTKVTSDDHKHKGRGKKRRDSSSEGSSDSYRRKRRRSGTSTKKDELLAAPASPPTAPSKPPPLEEPTPAAVAKPLSPPLLSPPPEDNMPVSPYSPGGVMYPLSSDAQGAYDNAPDEENTQEEESQSGSNKLACIVVLVVVGVCIIIAVVLALYPKLLFGGNGNQESTPNGQGPPGRLGHALNLLKGGSSEDAVGGHPTASEKPTTTWDAEVEKLVGKVWRRT
ncbi:hypothetical protein HPB50_001160 [Hyalomma asiaticum]|uniref:Uncharacterized protein n=1 Tax=Hyalomma asiaticum TaxID=266040 RepID=A0ACB7TGQ1_HYAAI|nr:hypothetical protein HPB50_001160 [Hyalomma asiaticum]